jgi:apolipoprotein N-acyltransferase
MHAWTIASPVGGQPVWWLQLMALTLLVILLDRCRSATAAAWLGSLFATCSIGGSVWWLYISLHVYGGLSSALAGLSVLGLSGFLALYYALAGAVFYRLRPRGPALRACLFAAVWLAADLLRATVLTGFPWGVGGYAHIDGPFSALAPWVGVYGIGAAAALFSALLAAAFVRPPQVRGAGQSLAVFVLILILAAPGRWHAAQGPVQAPAVTVTLLQANIAQEQKFESATGVRDALEWYATQPMSASTALVVAPETAIPQLPDQLPAGYMEKLRSHFVAGIRRRSSACPWVAEKKATRIQSLD